MSTLLTDGEPFTASPDLPRHRIRTLLDEGLIRPLLRGVFVDASVADSRELRVQAVELVRPIDGVACSETAAWLMGLDVFPPGRRHDSTPTFLVPHGTSRITRAGVDCRQANVRAADTMLLHGIPCTRPIRTASDLLRRQYRPYALASADAMVRAGVVDLAELDDYVHSLKGYPGIRQARGLVSIVDGRSESPGESWSRLRLHDAGLPPPDLQIEVIDCDGNDRRIDLGYLEKRVGVEYDGREHHTDPVDTAFDTYRRDALSQRDGWQWVVTDRAGVFGPDQAFELEVARLLGITQVRSRRWGTR